MKKLKKVGMLLIAALVLLSFLPALTLEGDPFFVTNDIVDPAYATYVIDSIEDVESPMPGRMILGHWNETSGSAFAFFFPKETESFQWDHKFYHSVYPGTGGSIYDRTALQHAAGGAYTISTQLPEAGGYRASVAGAKLSREFAAEYYNYDGHIYGYIYGGSGGGLATLGAIEGSDGIYDGAVPYVAGPRTAIPYNQSARVLSRVLFTEKAPLIAEALEIGGSGNPYEVLTDEEAYFFRILTNYGVPYENWKNYLRYLEISPSTFGDTTGTAAAGIPTSGLMEMCRYAIKKDPTFWDEFWTNPVYYGAGDSAEAKWFQSHEYTVDCTIQKIVKDNMDRPASLRLDQLPIDPSGVGLRYELYTADGQFVGDISGELNTKKKAFTVDFTYDDSIFPYRGTSSKVWNLLEEGMILRASNRKNLAMVTSFMYHLPSDGNGHLDDSEFYYLQQFTTDGSTLLDSWRDSNRAWMAMTTMGEQDQNGNIGSTKMIMIGCLADNEAFTTGTASYDLRLRKLLGDNYDNQIRTWWFDNADHMDSALSSSPQYYIAYSGGLIEALNQCSDWVQRGIAPTKGSEYEIVESQIILPDTDANERGGIQPTIDVLTANGSEGTKIAVKAGDTVDFKVSYTLVSSVPNLYSVEWDPIGLGSYEIVESKDNETSLSYTYAEPGIYMAAVKISSQSDLLAGTSYGLAQNFRKVRVVVEPTLATKIEEDKTTITFLGNDPADEAYGQIYGTRHYFPVSWTAGDKSGTFTNEKGVYTAVSDGYDKAVVTCEVKEWDGYRWVNVEDEEFSVSLPAAPKAVEPAPAQASSPAPVAEEAPSAEKSGSPVLWIVLCVVAVAAAAVCVILRRKKK